MTINKSVKNETYALFMLKMAVILTAINFLMVYLLRLIIPIEIQIVIGISSLAWCLTTLILLTKLLITFYRQNKEKEISE